MGGSDVAAKPRTNKDEARQSSAFSWNSPRDRGGRDQRRAIIEAGREAAIVILMRNATASG